MIKSASAKAAPISVAPSISSAPISTLPAVLIVANLESAIAAEELISAFTITPDAILNTPALVKPTSPLGTTGLKLVPSATMIAVSVLVPIVKSSPEIVKSPAIVAFAPLNVKAVVVPDLSIKFPELFVALPNVVPPSLKNISPPSASKIISEGPSTVMSPLDVAIVTAASPVEISSAATEVENPVSTILVPSENNNLVPLSVVPKVIPVPDAVLN